VDELKIPGEYQESGRVTREVKEWVKGFVRPGMGYLEVSSAVEAEIRRKGGRPAFPCGIGVDGVTAHYAPQPGEAGEIGEADLVKVDFGVHVDGYVTDTAVTVTSNPEHGLLMEAAERALAVAIETVRSDQRTGEVGAAIFREASRLGFRTIENLTGHTLERYVVHAGKSIPNVYMPNMPSLGKGEVFAIEPFVTYPKAAGYVVDGTTTTIYSIAVRKRTGKKELDEFVERVWEERKTLPFTPAWYAEELGVSGVVRVLAELTKKRIVRAYPTLVEASGSPVAQFEHTMALGDSGLEILT
jgi:methionyl aminopeptidase